MRPASGTFAHLRKKLSCRCPASRARASPGRECGRLQGSSRVTESARADSVTCARKSVAGAGGTADLDDLAVVHDVERVDHRAILSRPAVDVVLLAVRGVDRVGA